jgi:hypothetical protein
MNNPQKCSFYPKEKDCNACNAKMNTTPCDPNNKCIWFKHQLPNGLDPVLSNIKNGAWLCNYEPEQCWNSKLCNRSFFAGPVNNPCNMVKDIELESKILNRGTKYQRNYCKLQNK